MRSQLAGRAAFSFRVDEFGRSRCGRGMTMILVAARYAAAASSFRHRNENQILLFLDANSYSRQETMAGD